VQFEWTLDAYEGVHVDRVFDGRVLQHGLEHLAEAGFHTGLDLEGPEALAAEDHVELEFGLEQHRGRADLVRERLARFDCDPHDAQVVEVGLLDPLASLTVLHLALLIVLTIIG